ncbi:MAG: hypothetical protein IJM09_03630, partial [Neisseriaceae bacterium]|nr:hypothetical protein [Neisseriaceae bacterium]
KARLTQARQTFKNKMSSLPDDERRKVLAYEKGAMDIWEKVADKDTQERLQVNFYTSISEKIQDGKTTLPPAMSNAAAKEALENRRTEREQEMAMGR